MKILQVIDTLDAGGAERVFVDMCNILWENNQNVSALVFLENKGILASELKVPIVTFSRKSKWNVASMYKCSKILNNYDIIHCHNKHVFRYIKSIFLITGLDRKLVLQDHSSFKIQGIQILIFKFLLKPFFYIGVSENINLHASKTICISSNCLFLLENIIRKSKLIKNHNVTDFILVSNFKSSKNNLFALEILRNLPNKTLRLVGQIQQPLYFDNLKNYSKKNQLSVDFVTESKEVQPLLKCSLLGLHTSSSETGPLVLIEYLAQGLPFLAYETGEVAKILKPHFPQYFIDNFEIEEWKCRINKLITSPTDLIKMDAVFEEYFGEKQYYDKLINIYRCINAY